MEFRLLGPLEARQDGRELQLGGAKQRALLAILLLHANEAVSRHSLIEGLWGEGPPPTAAHTLDNYVSRLRKTLGEGRVERRSPGYALRVEPGELDFDRFKQFVEQGRKELATGAFGEAAASLRTALEQWRGSALADLVYEPFASAEAHGLEQRRLSALEERIDADLALGRSSELVPELEGLVRAHPLRERLLAQLMLALYRSGRHAAALDAYRIARRGLAEELGLEPGPTLQRLEHEILQHDPGLEWPGEKLRLVEPGRKRHQARLLLAATAALAIAVIAGVVLGTRGTTASNHQAKEGNQLLRLDARSGRVGVGKALAAAPAAIASGADSLWVADTSGNAVLRTDALSGDVVDRIPLAVQPGDLTVGGGSVWIAGTAGASITRVDTATGEVTQTIPLGSNPSGICFCEGELWVTDPGDAALLRVDPATGGVRQTVTLTAPPSAVAAGGGSVWVASYEAATVTEVDPRSNAAVATVHVGEGPTALAFGAGSVWAANKLDGTVSRIDARTARVVDTIATGSAPAALAYGNGFLWVANEFSRTVSRIDPTRPAVARNLDLGGEPTSLAVAGEGVWVGTRQQAQHRGGTLVLLGARRFTSVDAQVDYEATPGQFLGLVNDGLVAYDHTSGRNGFQLVPDLALGIPTPTDDGRTYVFRLRPGIRYSDGRQLQASDFARAAVRLFHVHSPIASFFRDMLGGPACIVRPARCRLPNGVVADDAARTVSFHLSRPDPDFLFKLALGLFVPIPPGTPMRDIGIRPIPGTGPYRFAKVDAREIVFVRNPRFREWSHAAQPDGNPDRMVWRFGMTPDQEIRAVAAGRADWTGDFPSDLNEVARRYASQLHSNVFPGTFFVQLNTRRPPFDDVRVRRALNYAIDRAAIVRLRGGPIANTPSCQVIPPSLPGYRRYCPYTLDPRPDGRWTAPDLARARTLVDALEPAGNE